MESFTGLTSLANRPPETGFPVQDPRMELSLNLDDSGESMELRLAPQISFLCVSEAAGLLPCIVPTRKKSIVPTRKRLPFPRRKAFVFARKPCRSVA